MTRSRLVPLALVLAASVALAGCVPAGDPSLQPFPDIPDDAVGEFVGVDLGELGEALEQSLPERMSQNAEFSAGVLALIDDDLNSAAFAELDTSTDPDAFGVMQPVSLVTAVTGTPGLDVPIVREGSETSTSEIGGHPSTSTRSETRRVENQTETTVQTGSTTLGDYDNGSGAKDSTSFGSTKVVCEPDEGVSGEFEGEYVRSVRANGEEIEVRMEVEGRFVRNDDGSLGILGVVARIGAETRHADGSVTPANSVVVESSIPNWAAGTDITDARITYRVVETSEGADPDKAGNAGVAALLFFIDQIEGAAERAEELRKESGLCVRLQVDTHNVSQLGEGERAPFTAWVVDVATGEELHEATIESSAWPSTVTPETGVGRTTFDIVTSGDPTYTAVLTASTPRGGHQVRIEWDAPGWRFEGVSYGYTIPSHLGAIPATVTWSGQVCGRVGDEWQVTAQISSEFGSPVVSLPMNPVRLENIPTGTHAVLVYEEILEPEPGQPPFRLWIDEHNPEIVPTDHRVEIHPEAITTNCVS